MTSNLRNLLFALVLTCCKVDSRTATTTADAAPTDAEGAAVAAQEQACEAGNSSACDMLGRRYEHGKGVQKDAAKAASLYQKACEGDHARGCSDLAYLYNPRRRCSERRRQSRRHL